MSSSCREMRRRYEPADELPVGGSGVGPLEEEAMIQGSDKGAH